MAKPVEHLGQHHPVSADPESFYLDLLAQQVYPDVKKVRPDASITDIRTAAEEFRGASFKGHLHIWLRRAILEPNLPKGPTIVTNALLEEPGVEEAAISASAPSSFIDRLKAPLQVLGIKL